MKQLILFAFLILGAAFSAHAAPGDLDTLNANIVGSYVEGVATQLDGKTIITGRFDSVLGQLRNNIARLNADGTLDEGFNPDADSRVIGVYVQADGKLLIWGQFTTVGGIGRSYIARLNADGTVDAGFNPDVNNWVFCAAVQVDGKIVFGGQFTSVGGTARNRIARVAADGTLDTGFDPNANASVNFLAVQTDGRLLFGGQMTTVGGISHSHIARLNANGTLDKTFNPGLNSGPFCAVELMDGTILLAGSFTTAGGALHNCFARLTTDGVVDTLSLSNNANAIVTMAEQADGKILLGGNFTSVSATVRNRVARLNANKTLDTGFNPNADGEVDGLALQPDGKVLVGGAFANVAGTERNKFARLLNDSATQSLTATDTTELSWTRDGSLAMVQQVAFEVSTDGGTSYTPLVGTNTRSRVGTSVTWRLSGLSLPTSGMIRARGRTYGGTGNGSSSLVELAASFSGLTTPAPTVTASTADLRTDAPALVIHGTGFDAVTPGNNTVVFTPAGIGTVTGATATTLTVTNFSGFTLGALHAVVTSHGLGSGAAVQVATVVEPHPGEWDFFDAGVDGEVHAIALQLDGKTVIGGTFSSAQGSPRYRLARLNADGTLEASFPPVVSGIVYCIVLQADGKIVVGGQFNNIGGVTRNSIARFNADGTLDTGFNPNPNNFISCMAVQADGKLLIGGPFTSVGGTFRSYFARINADGTLDTGFNPKVLGPVNSVAVQMDGKILLGGSMGSVGGAERASIARVAANGTLDADFAPAVDGFVNCVTEQPDGRILLGGDFTAVNGAQRKFLARVSADGVLDTSFNTDANNSLRYLAVQANGSILLGGTFTILGANWRDGFGRVTASGGADSSFMPSTAHSVYGSVSAMAMQADGKILLGGRLTIEDWYLNFARLINDPATQSLTAADTTRVVWTRGGSAPDVSQIAVELSTDGGATYTPLVGTASRVAGTSDWQLSGLSLPTSGHLRARGRMSVSGYLSSSSSLVECLGSYSVPAIVVTGNGVAIASGDSTPALADQTDFGTVSQLNQQVTHRFTIRNVGLPALTLSGAPKVQISGAAAGDFKVVALPGSPVAGGGSTSFDITFDPSLPGLRSATVSIASDDLVAPAFSFAISGFGGLTTQLVQTITFAPPVGLYLGQSPFALTAHSSAGLPVSLRVVSGPGSITGGVLTLTGPGTIKVEASQAGGGNVKAAVPVVKAIIAVANPVALTLVKLAQVYDGSPKPIATVGGGVPVISYKIGTAYVETAPTAAGSYAVKAVAGAVTKTGTLVIAKAPLYVTPESKRKFVGEANPALTYSITGYRGSDTSAVITKAPVLVTTAALASPGGLYPITASGATALNYSFIYQQGTLVVESFAGSYEALFVGGDGLPVGKLTITVPATGKTFTAKLATASLTTALVFTGDLATDSLHDQANGTAAPTILGIPHSLTFTLPLYGAFSASATRNGLSLGSTNDGQKLSTAGVLYAGYHTVVLEPAAAGTGVPVGAGWATATIGTTGIMTISGRLGDDTAFTATLLPDVQSNPGYRVFVQPYLAARSQSYIGGAFNLVPHPSVINRRYVAAAGMTWKKSGLATDVSYRSGFGPVSTVLMLDPWLPPTAATKTAPAITLPQRLGLTVPNFAVAHSNTGSLANGNLPTRLALNAANVVSVQTPVANLTKWKISTLNTINGTFTGSFELADETVKRPVIFSGVLRQPADSLDALIGDGHYLLPPLSGAEKSTGEVNMQRP